MGPIGPVEYLKSLGIEPITGEPYKPTVQGKNERFQRTLHLYLNKHAPASTMNVLQAHTRVWLEFQRMSVWTTEKAEIECSGRERLGWSLYSMG